MPPGTPPSTFLLTSSPVQEAKSFSPFLAIFSHFLINKDFSPTCPFLSVCHPLFFFQASVPLLYSHYTNHSLTALIPIPSTANLSNPLLFSPRAYIRAPCLSSHSPAARRTEITRLHFASDPRFCPISSTSAPPPKASWPANAVTLASLPRGALWPAPSIFRDTCTHSRTPHFIQSLAVPSQLRLFNCDKQARSCRLCSRAPVPNHLVPSTPTLIRLSCRPDS